MRARRRVSVAFALSVAAHGAVAAAVIGSSLLSAWPRTPIEVELTTMKLEDPQDLPLGARPAGENQEKGTGTPPPVAEAIPTPPAPKKPKPKPKPPPDSPEGEAPPRPQSVRSYGPEGSRVTVLMRVDRLRDTPYAASVDSLLMRLPDRRDLLEGTELDLYRDFDALLVATPNPTDPAVTFLAVRHRLTDGALREALERGARATGRRLAWRTERGRPFAERRAAVGGGAGKDSSRPWASRDDRLILLPAPRLAVVTPPAYASLILKGRPTAKPTASPDGSAGAGAAVPEAAAPVASEHADWTALIRRIDAEDSIMPANAVVVLSAEDLFAPPGAHAGVAPGTRGAVDEAPTHPRGRTPTVFGLPVPQGLTATIGIAPQPFADLDATFTAEAQAARWETEWPALRRQFLANPLVVLTGFSALLGRVTLSRDGATVHVHIQATELELIRVMQLLSTQVFPRGG